MPKTIAKKKATKKAAVKKAASAPKRTRRVKCACASCTCTVDLTKGYRKGNLVFCGKICATRACDLEVCRCEHDHCVR